MLTSCQCLLTCLSRRTASILGDRHIAIVTERPSALFHLHEYAAATPRLHGLTWGAEDLGSAVGALANRDADGRWLPPYELARSLTLFAAAAAGVAGHRYGLYRFSGSRWLAQYAADARRDGFAGMLAIHPDQVAVINAAFLPTRRKLRGPGRSSSYSPTIPSRGVRHGRRDD